MGEAGSWKLRRNKPAFAGPGGEGVGGVLYLIKICSGVRDYAFKRHHPVVCHIITRILHAFTGDPGSEDPKNQKMYCCFAPGRVQSCFEINVGGVGNQAADEYCWGQCLWFYLLIYLFSAGDFSFPPQVWFGFG